MFVGIFAAAMSSVSSALSALASVSTMDLGLGGRVKTDAAKLKWSRGATLFWGGMLVVVAFLSREVESVMNAAFSLVGLTSGGLLGGVAMSLVLKRGSAWPVITGLAVSLGGMIGVHSTGAVHWPWYTLIGCTMMLTVAVPLHLLTKSGRDES